MLDRVQEKLKRVGMSGKRNSLKKSASVLKKLHGRLHRKGNSSRKRSKRFRTKRKDFMVKEQTVVRQGIGLTNFVMEKR